jgi:hypothetical protein
MRGYSLQSNEELQSPMLSLDPPEEERLLSLVR